jgi:hypothetical protein
VHSGVDKPNLATFNKLSQQSDIPAPVSQIVKHIINKAITPDEITNLKSFKQALLNSGAFSERQLVSQSSHLNDDFKINITKLMETLTTLISISSKTDTKALSSLLNRLPAQVTTALLTSGRSPQQLLSVLLSSSAATPQETVPPSTNLDAKQAMSLAQQLGMSLNKQVQTNLVLLQTLLKETEQVHRKIQLNQIGMLKEPELSQTQQTSWLVDLPIKEKNQLDLVQLKIEQERRKQSKAEEQDDIWNVELRLDTQNLGPVMANVKLNHSIVTIELCAQRQESAQLLADNLPLLHHELKKLDISIQSLECRCGAVPERSLAEVTVMTSSILDISV